MCVYIYVYIYNDEINHFCEIDICQYNLKVDAPINDYTKIYNYIFLLN